MLHNFKSYQLAKKLYQSVEKKKLPHHMRDQLLRASLSVVLNLSEGSGKRTRVDRARFFNIALGSLRETQAILDLLSLEKEIKLADHLGACIWKLIQNPGSL